MCFLDSILSQPTEATFFCQGRKWTDISIISVFFFSSPLLFFDINLSTSPPPPQVSGRILRPTVLGDRAPEASHVPSIQTYVHMQAAAATGGHWVQPPPPLHPSLSSPSLLLPLAFSLPRAHGDPMVTPVGPLCYCCSWLFRCSNLVFFSLSLSLSLSLCFSPPLPSLPTVSDFPGGL